MDTHSNCRRRRAPHVLRARPVVSLPANGELWGRHRLAKGSGNTAHAAQPTTAVPGATTAPRPRSSAHVTTPSRGFTFLGPGNAPAHAPALPRIDNAPLALPHPRRCGGARAVGLVEPPTPAPHHHQECVRSTRDAPRPLVQTPHAPLSLSSPGRAKWRSARSAPTRHIEGKAALSVHARRRPPAVGLLLTSRSTTQSKDCISHGLREGGREGRWGWVGGKTRPLGGTLGCVRGRRQGSLAGRVASMVRGQAGTPRCSTHTHTTHAKGRRAAVGTPRRSACEAVQGAVKRARTEVGAKAGRVTSWGLKRAFVCICRVVVGRGQRRAAGLCRPVGRWQRRVKTFWGSFRDGVAHEARFFEFLGRRGGADVSASRSRRSCVWPGGW